MIDMFKYINIDSFRLEVHFSQISSLTSSTNERSAQETIAYMADMPYFTCEKLCLNIQKAIAAIERSSSRIKQIVPKNILDIGRSVASVTPERLEVLLPFFEWLEKLIYENENMRTRCKSELRNVAAHLDDSFGNFLETFAFSTVPHRIRIISENDRITCKTFDRLWGTAGFSALNAESSGFFPSFGTLEWLEAEINRDGIFEFRFLIDENFSDDPQNILDDKKYNIISVSSAELSFFSSLNNYVEFFNMSGNSAHYRCVRILSELNNKAVTLGKHALSMAEKTILPLAQLCHAISLETDKKIRFKKANFAEILNVLDNRFAFDRMIDCLNKSELESIKGLVKALRDISENFDRDDVSMTLPYIKHTFRYFNLFFGEGSQNRFELANYIIEYLNSFDYEYDNKMQYIKFFDKTVESFRPELEEHLFSHGYSGTFPHYEKVCGNFKHLLTINTDVGLIAPKSGNYTYDLSISLAKCTLTNKQIPKNARAADLDNTNCKYSKIASEIDGGLIKLVYNSYNSVNNLNDVYSNNFKPFIDVAFCSFENKAIPKFYRDKHLKKLHKHSVGKAALNVLPFVIFAAAIAILFAMRYFTSTVEHFILLTAILISACFCILLYIIFVKIRNKYTIWKI